MSILWEITHGLVAFHVWGRDAGIDHHTHNRAAPLRRFEITGNEKGIGQAVRNFRLAISWLDEINVTALKPVTEKKKRQARGIDVTATDLLEGCSVPLIG